MGSTESPHGRADCPAEADVAEYCAGRSAVVAAEQIAAHLATCAECRALADQLREEREVAALLREARGDVDAPRRKRLIRRAQDALHAVPREPHAAPREP